MAPSLFMTQSEARSGAGPDPRRPALVDSLRRRFAEAEQRRDAAAKQALFQEAVYLGIQPEEFMPPA
ncbi:MAG: hypothetical protein R6U00_12350 [Prochlorococcaceae cyanobacterium]|jgi:hypothetical protein